MGVVEATIKKQERGRPNSCFFSMRHICMTRDIL